MRKPFLLLGLLVVITLFAGCSREKEDKQQASTSTQATQSETKTEETATATTQNTTAPASFGIGTRFQYGDSLDKIKQTLGAPISESGFLGSKLVKFKEEMYLVSYEDDKVVGMIITSPSISIYKVNIGMKQQQITELLGQPQDASFDDTELGAYTVTYSYMKDQMIFVSETETSPIQYAIVYRKMPESTVATQQMPSFRSYEGVWTDSDDHCGNGIYVTLKFTGEQTATASLYAQMYGTKAMECGNIRVDDAGDVEVSFDNNGVAIFTFQDGRQDVSIQGTLRLINNEVTLSTKHVAGEGPGEAYFADNETTNLLYHRNE